MDVCDGRICNKSSVSECVCVYVLRASMEMGFTVVFSQLVLISTIYMELYTTSNV